MKVMFVSPYCLLDPSSGASISCRTMIEGLAARGHEARAVSAAIFDRPRFRESADFLKHIGARPFGAAVQRPSAWSCARDGVRFLISPSKAQKRVNLTCAEVLAFQRVFMAAVNRQRPDVVMAYGGKPVDRDNYRWLRDLGIPIVFYVANPNYGDARTFRDVDVVVTDTKATAALYKKRIGVEFVPIGKAIKPFPMADGAPRDCVTFINPAPEKGASIFVAIVQDAARRGLAARFLVVESRKRLEPTLAALGLSPADLPNVEYLPLQEDMRRVWSRTRVLLHPSLWHESGPRVVLEACSAGVPVLATTSGGIAELLGDGGFLFPVPAEVSKKFTNPASAETARAWGDILEPLLTDPEFYARASARALAQWHSFHAHDAVAKLEAIMEGLIARKKQVGRVTGVAV